LRIDVGDDGAMLGSKPVIASLLVAVEQSPLETLEGVLTWMVWNALRWSRSRG
jgi:hypothetical protein